MLCSNSAFRTQDGFLAYISALKDGVLRAGLINIAREQLNYEGWKKRYGKSVLKCAPSYFVQMADRKAESAGGTVTKQNPWKTKLSSVCICGTKVRKKLSLRIHRCQTATCPIADKEFDRDLFSAYMGLFATENSVDFKASTLAFSEQGWEPILAAASSSFRETTKKNKEQASRRRHKRGRNTSKASQEDQSVRVPRSKRKNPTHPRTANLRPIPQTPESVA